MTANIQVEIQPDSRQFLLEDLTQMQINLARLIQRVTDCQHDPLPNPVWNTLLDAAEELNSAVRAW